MKSEKLNLKCPDCGSGLRDVIAKTQYGMSVMLDQCFDCGGIWFDSLELYPLPKTEVEKIEGIKLEKLQEPSCLGTEKKLCPKCGIALKNFQDFNFPKDLEVEHCEKCGGIWMNKGEAMEFKKWQENKIKSSTYLTEKEKEFQKNIKEWLDMHRDKDFELMGKMGKTLSLRLDPMTNRPLYDSDYGASEYNKASETVSLAMYIIYMLLKLFLKI